ncbi:hypothetical protein GQ44DRAFT_728699 [Phaeosphaeriaceae sp. PMI808]|nr:hypothetical protein GQ44DRAFT_728699 [Phaeosphaeriaceae sp. PMI808]
MAPEPMTINLVELGTLLNRKLQRIPEHVLPTLTIDDILTESPRALQNPAIPSDIQLPFFLHNRYMIDRHKCIPVKDEKEQSLDITRAIFFYHLNEPHHFQRYHEISRWNLAFFGVLLHMVKCQPHPIRSPHRLGAPLSDLGTYDIPLAAQHFMTSYLIAVMERHNRLTVFEKREEFIKRWKASKWDLFDRFNSSQKKMLKKQMIKLNKEWEVELDKAIVRLGRAEYDVHVAPFVGSIIPGRKDQGILPEPLKRSSTATQPASPDAQAQFESNRKQEQNGSRTNELLDALRVPIPELSYDQEEVRYNEEATTPSSLRFAITCMQEVRPAELLPTLMQLFPTKEEHR